MKKLIQFIVLSSVFVIEGFTQDIPTIYAKTIDSSDYRFKNNLKEYHEAYEWKLWSFPFRKSNHAMQVPSTDSLGKPLVLFNDLDLNTAWTSEDSLSGMGMKFDIYFKYDQYGFYGTAYQFFGKINVFNGNCSSPDSWQNYSRIKTFNLYFNDSLLCKVELKDTWHFQNFDIASYFKNIYNGKYLDAKYEIKDGDKLTLEIMEIYSGNKYKQVVLSEFLMQGASN